MTSIILHPIQKFSYKGLSVAVTNENNKFRCYVGGLIYSLFDVEYDTKEIAIDSTKQIIDSI